MNKQVVIFNGPPGSGKDFGAHCVEQTLGAAHHEMKYKLIELAQAIYCLSPAQWGVMYTREEKDRPQALLNGRTPREALIHISETVIKPNFGANYFGRATARMLSPGLNTIADGGFIEEPREIAQVIGAENMLVIRVFAKGGDWGNDSRGYYEPAQLSAMAVAHIDLYNDMTVAYTEAVLAVVREFQNAMGERPG